MEMTKPIIDCMQNLRRRIRAEQGSDIRLSQADAIAQMLALAMKSRDEKTRALGKELSQLTGSELPASQPLASTTATPSNTYRGAMVQNEEAHPAHTPSVRIYRGQRVYA